MDSNVYPVQQLAACHILHRYFCPFQTSLSIETGGFLAGLTSSPADGRGGSVASCGLIVCAVTDWSSAALGFLFKVEAADDDPLF